MKYKIIKSGLNLKDAIIGDIVEMNDGAAQIALGYRLVELYVGELPAKHVLILTEPATVKGVPLPI